MADDITVTEMQECVEEDVVAESDYGYDAEEEQEDEADMSFRIIGDDMNYSSNQSAFEEEAKLPSNKTDYMKMSVAEKALSYPYEGNSTEELFNMVRDYFESVGLDTSFHSVYEEYKLLVNYYEEQKSERYLGEMARKITKKISVFGIDIAQMKDYSSVTLLEIFDFKELDYSGGIKLFNKVIDELGVTMANQERYELFDRIYNTGMKEKQVDYRRNGR